MAADQSSSAMSISVPAAGPPTEMSAPSSRPYVDRAVSTSVAGVSGSALSATTPVALSSPSAATASSSDSW